MAWTHGERHAHAQQLAQHHKQPVVCGCCGRTLWPRLSPAQRQIVALLCEEPGRRWSVPQIRAELELRSAHTRVLELYQQGRIQRVETRPRSYVYFCQRTEAAAAAPAQGASA